QTISLCSIAHRPQGRHSCKGKGRTPRSVRPLSTPHSTETLEIAILGRALELHVLFAHCRRRRCPWFRIIRNHLSVTGRHESDSAFGVVAPAVDIGVFLSDMMYTIDLVLQTSAVFRLDNG